MTSQTIGQRLRHGWNAFFNKEPDPQNYKNPNYYSYSYGRRPDRVVVTATNERSIVTSIYNRLAMDISTIEIRHVKLDKDRRYEDTLWDSALNERFTVFANKDQTPQAFFQDVAMSLFDEGCVAIVPVDTTLDPNNHGGFRIDSLRVGRIIDWMPDHVRIRLYNDRNGKFEEITMAKEACAIIENPLYAVMNEENSTLRRLVSKLEMLDVVDKQSSSGKLDIIIQLPYVVKSEGRKAQAEKRRKDIEAQLAGSQYGIAYIDGTEKITQLNRPAENNLQTQVEYLTSMLYGQLGVSEQVIDGTADEATMLNYFYRTIDPILSAIVAEMRIKFLTKTARSRLQSIMYFREPFKLVPISQIAEVGDKLTRNAIVSSNDMRGFIGLKPSKQEGADDLSNKNLNPPTPTTVPKKETKGEDDE